MSIHHVDDEARDRRTATSGAGAPPARGSEPHVRLTPRGEERLGRGHPWVYRSEIEQVDASAGDLVHIRGRRRTHLGYGLYSDRSAIALRGLTTARRRPGAAFWRARLEAAIAYRATLGIDATAYRLVHGEGDRLPGLVVDRYDQVLVVQALTQGMDRQLAELCDLLVERLEPSGLLVRNDARVRTLEGLDLRVTARHGTVPPEIEVREGTRRFGVDPWAGQKTGLFLDQRENHTLAARYATGRGLDCFSYVGGFALSLATRCHEVTAVDISAPAVDRIATHAARNGVTNVRPQVGNVFDLLRELDRGDASFETIVLDPPAFAKNRAAVRKAMAGYKEINLRALKLLSPGGTLITSSCSYHLDAAGFGRVVAAAAADARAVVRLVETRSQSRDHPVLVGVPETAYLKCLVLEKVSGR